MSPQNTKLIGAVAVQEPLELRGKAMLIGVGTPAAFAGAVTLVLNGAGRRARVELTGEEAGAVVDVLSAEAPIVTVHAYRSGPDVFLTVAGFILKVVGDEMQNELLAELRHRARGHGVASGEISPAPLRHLLMLTEAEAARIGVASGQHEAIIVDRQIVEHCLVATFEVRDMAGDPIGRIERRYPGRGAL